MYIVQIVDYLKRRVQALAAHGGPKGAQFRASPTVAAALDDAPSSTLTQDFHTRLDNLLRTLVHARPHFVRCLRANATETPMLFERPTVAKQVGPIPKYMHKQSLNTTYLLIRKVDSPLSSGTIHLNR